MIQVQDIREMSGKSRLQPFEIRLSDGRALPVSHPEFLAFPKEGDIFIYLPEGGRFQLISLGEVVSLDTVLRKRRSKRTNK